MTLSHRKIRAAGSLSTLDARGLELLDRGIGRAALRTTLPREGFDGLRTLVENDGFDSEEFRSTILLHYDPRARKGVDAHTASLVFDLLAKELALTGRNVYVTTLRGLMRGIDKSFDPDENNMLQADYLFVRDFFLVGNHGLPGMTEEMYDLESYFFGRVLSDSKTFLFTHEVSLPASQQVQQWWSESLLTFLKTSSTFMELSKTAQE
jgi:hypothetical protein